MAPRKEKPKEYGASGIDFQKWFPFSSDPDSMQLRKWEFWESLRRHPEYLELCKGIPFNKITGLISGKWLINLSNRDKLKRAVDRARELFGVESIMDPDRPYNELPAGAVETLGVAPDAVTLISPHIRPGHTFPDADFADSYRKRFIEDGRFITLRIDITQLDGEIRQKAGHFISEQRTIAGITPHKKERFYKAAEAFQVYDLKVARKTDTEIIKELWPDEFAKSDTDALAREYKKLCDKYQRAGFEDWHERAENETYGSMHDSGVKFLYQRVVDRDQSAKKRIEEIQQK